MGAAFEDVVVVTLLPPPVVVYPDVVVVVWAGPCESGGRVDTDAAKSGKGSGLSSELASPLTLHCVELLLASPPTISCSWVSLALLLSGGLTELLLAGCSSGEQRLSPALAVVCGIQALGSMVRTDTTWPLAGFTPTLLLLEDAVVCWLLQLARLASQLLPAPKWEGTAKMEVLLVGGGGVSTLMGVLERLPAMPSGGVKVPTSNGCSAELQLFFMGDRSSVATGTNGGPFFCCWAETD